MEKVYIITIKEKMCAKCPIWQVYSSMEKALKDIEDRAAKEKNVKLEKTEFKNERKVFNDGKFVHTLRIEEALVR